MSKNNEKTILFLGIASIVALDITTLSFPNTREFNDNNPFGVTNSEVTSTFFGVIGVDSPLLIFSNIIFGIIAGFALMKSNYFDAGYNTVDAIGTRWSGDTSGAYAQSLAEITGFLPGQVLNYWFDAITLMAGIAKMENGPGTIIPTTFMTIGLTIGGLY